MAVENAIIRGMMTGDKTEAAVQRIEHALQAREEIRDSLLSQHLAAMHAPDQDRTG